MTDEMNGVTDISLAEDNQKRNEQKERDEEEHTSWQMVKNNEGGRHGSLNDISREVKHWALARI